MSKRITKEIGMQIIYGGWFLGGGGGARFGIGLEVIEKLFNMVDSFEMKDISEFGDDEILLSASLVGAPSAKDQYITEQHWKRVLEIFQQSYDKPIAGFMGNENGGGASTNGWIVAAATGLPLVDALGADRAVPVAPMACMGLNKLENYQSIQAFAGGKPDLYHDALVRGTIDGVGRVGRIISAEAGGAVCVLRNPLPVKYVRENSAVGGLTLAYKLGKLFMENDGKPNTLIEILKKEVELEVYVEGDVVDFELKPYSGLDIGSVKVANGKESVDVTYWNEYMTVERNGERLSTFPNLIHMLNAETGMPVCSCDICKGQKVIVVSMPRKYMKLGKGLILAECYAETEAAVGKKLFDAAR